MSKILLFVNGILTDVILLNRKLQISVKPVPNSEHYGQRRRSPMKDNSNAYEYPRTIYESKPHSRFL